MPGEQIAIFILFAGIAIIAGILGAIQTARRKRELMEWSQANGFRFTEAKDRSIEKRFPEFRKLREGHNRFGYNLMEGDWKGCSFVAFDYHYETYSRDSKGNKRTNHHHFSAVIIGTDLALKPLLIRPENVLDKVADFFGAKDIEFESAEFNRRFFIKAPDRKWAYDLIHTRTMEFLLSRPSLEIEFEPYRILATKGKTFSVVEFGEAADTIAGILALLPEYAIQELRKEFR